MVWSRKHKMVNASSMSSTAVRARSHKSAITRSLVQSRPAIRVWSKLMGDLSGHVVSAFPPECQSGRILLPPVMRNGRHLIEFLVIIFRSEEHTSELQSHSF